MKKSLRMIALILAILYVFASFAACKRNSQTDPIPDPTPVNPPSSDQDEDDEQLSYEKGNRFDYTNCTIQSFDYNGVRISNDSPFAQEFNYAMEYLLSIPDDDLLKVMRIREGKDVEDSEFLGGWYDGGLWVAATFGQYVSSLARGYAITGDERLKEKATNLIDGWADCISEDGFFYFSPDRNTNSTHYTYDKVVLMCLDVYTYIGGEVGERALGYLRTATEFAIDYLSRARKNAGPDGPHSGQSVEGGNSDIEWYILSENLYRAYLATGDEIYKSFADVWNYDYFWNALLTGDGTKYYNVHAYSHTNSISGAALKYMITGDTYYLNVLKKAYKMYNDYELYPNGMYGTGERLVGTVKDLNSAIASNINNCEVPCNTWAGFKITKYLTELTGSAQYMDWGEELLYNGVLGTLRIKDDSVRRGISFYYANYQKDASKQYYGASWPCCSGTYFMNLCDVADRIYFKDAENLYVANYVSSQVENNYGNRNVILTQKTNFPSDNIVEMTISCTSTVNFNLKLRIPEWSDTFTVRLNGNIVSGKADAEGWFTVAGQFADGDKIVLELNPTLALEQIVDGDNSSLMAMYGNVYMVAENAESTVITLDANKNISDYIVGTNGQVIYVRDENDFLFRFVPYYLLEEGAEYAGNLTLNYIGGN